MALSNYPTINKTTFARTLATAFVMAMTYSGLNAETPASRPVLVVGVTVEGLSADYLELLRDKFGPTA